MLTGRVRDVPVRVKRDKRFGTMSLPSCIHGMTSSHCNCKGTGNRYDFTPIGLMVFIKSPFSTLFWTSLITACTDLGKTTPEQEPPVFVDVFEGFISTQLRSRKCRPKLHITH